MSKYRTKIDATGPDGNVFVVIGNAVRLLRDLEGATAANKLRDDCMSLRSYNEVIEKVREFFPVKVS